MDFQLITQRFGGDIRQLRINRGLTQAQLASLCAITRQKIIEIEQGSGSVALHFYARVLGVLDCELKVIPARLPTLDELEEIFK